MDRFLLATNPMRANSALFVIHLLEPKAMIECLPGHVAPPQLHKHYSFTNIDGDLEEWTLSAYPFFTTDFITEPEVQASKMLDRAWHWYRAYLQWEAERDAALD